MKIKRYKKSHKTLVFFKNYFNYREPYQVLIDATFCQAALKHRIIIEDQIQNYFHTQVKLLTTQCIILEAESLGTSLINTTQIVKQFYVHKCGHEDKPVRAAECIKQMTRNSRYIVASQDRTLQNILRKVPGRCLLYLHKATPVLEAPSEASQKWVRKNSRKLITVECEKKIEILKQKEGLKTNTDDTNESKYKRSKNPNPLSCKKSKKQLIRKSPVKSEKNNVSKTKRKRIKIPPHVKEVLINKKNFLCI